MSRYGRLSLEEHAELGEMLKTARDYLERATRTLAPVTEMNAPTLKKIRRVIYDLVDIKSRMENRLFGEHENTDDITIHFGPRKSTGNE